MKKVLLSSLVAAVASFVLATNAMALGTIGVAVEYADLGNGVTFAAPGVKGSLTIFEPLPMNSLRAALGYYSISGTYNATNVSLSNLQYGLIYNIDLVMLDLYAQAGFDTLNGNINGSFGGFAAAQNISTSSMYYGAGLNLKPLPFITVSADARFVNGLFGTNRSDTILTAGLNLNF